MYRNSVGVWSNQFVLEVNKGTPNSVALFLNLKHTLEVTSATVQLVNVPCHLNHEMLVVPRVVE